MYLFLLFLCPLLFLINPYLAMVGLVGAIAGMYFQRTQAPKRPSQRAPVESEYKPGYEN